MNKILTILIATVISISAMFAQEARQDTIPVYDSRNTELFEPKAKMYEKGYRADIELSAAIADQYGISSSHGFSFGNGLYIGGGVGFAAELRPEYSSDIVFLVPVFADLKYSFINQKCSPFVGIRAGEILDITQNGLRAFASPAIGVDISRFSVKVGYELQYGAMGACEGLIRHYAKIGIGFTF